MNIDWFLIFQNIVAIFGLTIFSLLAAFLWYLCNSVRFSTRKNIRFLIDDKQVDIGNVVSIVTYSNCIKVISMQMGSYYQSACFSRKNKISWIVL